MVCNLALLPFSPSPLRHCGTRLANIETVYSCMQCPAQVAGHVAYIGLLQSPSSPLPSNEEGPEDKADTLAQPNDYLLLTSFAW